MEIDFLKMQGCGDDLVVLDGAKVPAATPARLPSLAQRHLSQVILAHEADQQALRVVIPRDAWDHGYLSLEVDAGGRGFGGIFGGTGG